MTNPIRRALEAGDLCEAGRLYAKQLAEMGGPDNPYGGGGVESRHAAKEFAGTRASVVGNVAAGSAIQRSRTSDLPASTLPHPAPPAATPAQNLGGGAGPSTQESE